MDIFILQMVKSNHLVIVPFDTPYFHLHLHKFIIYILNLDQNLKYHSLKILT